MKHIDGGEMSKFLRLRFEKPELSPRVQKELRIDFYDTIKNLIKNRDNLWLRFFMENENFGYVNLNLFVHTQKFG